MFDFSVFGTAQGWISLLSLSAMEIVLGIDNVIFIDPEPTGEAALGLPGRRGQRAPG